MGVVVVNSRNAPRSRLPWTNWRRKKTEPVVVAPGGDGTFAGFKLHNSRNAPRSSSLPPTGAFVDARKAVRENIQETRQLRNKTADLAGASQDFAAMSRQLREREQNERRLLF